MNSFHFVLLFEADNCFIRKQNCLIFGVYIDRSILCHIKHENLVCYVKETDVRQKCSYSQIIYMLLMTPFLYSKRFHFALHTWGFKNQQKNFSAPAVRLGSDSLYKRWKIGFIQAIQNRIICFALKKMLRLKNLFIGTSIRYIYNLHMSNFNVNKFEWLLSAEKN